MMKKTFIFAVFLFSASVFLATASERQANEVGECIKEFSNIRSQFLHLFEVIELGNNRDILNSLKDVATPFKQLCDKCNMRIPDIPASLGTAQNCLEDIQSIKILISRLKDIHTENPYDTSTYILIVSAFSGFASRLPKTINDCTKYVNNS